MSGLLLFADSAIAAPGRYIPFVTPMPLWDYWYVLIVPLCLAVSIVYKALKCRTMREVPWQAAIITFWILAAMAAMAAALVLIVKVREVMRS